MFSIFHQALKSAILHRVAAANRTLTFAFRWEIFAIELSQRQLFIQKIQLQAQCFFFFLSNGDFNIFISLWRIGVGRSTWNGSNWSNFKIFLRPWTCPMALLKLAALFPDRLNYQLNFYPHPIGTFSWLERVSKSAIWRPIARHHREDAGRADAIGRPFKSIVNWMQMAGSMWQMKETGQSIGKATVEDGWTRYEWSCWAVTINAERWAIERAVRMIKRS